jgi:deoxyribonuclease V
MLACVDVHYTDASATAACLTFATWTDANASYERVTTSSVPPAEYQSGELYRRELPYALAVLGELRERPSLVIVDGYVWLGEGRRGLGAHLQEALGCAVVGVAKSRFRSADAMEVPHALQRHR